LAESAEISPSPESNCLVLPHTPLMRLVKSNLRHKFVCALQLYVGRKKLPLPTEMRGLKSPQNWEGYTNVVVEGVLKKSPPTRVPKRVFDGPKCLREELSLRAYQERGKGPRAKRDLRWKTNMGGITL